MTYQTQKKIYEGMELFNERLRNVGVMQNYEGSDFSSWSSKERVKSNYLLNILQTPASTRRSSFGDSRYEEVIREIERSNYDWIDDETPPEGFDQLGLSPRLGGGSSIADQIIEEKLYVDRGDNTDTSDEYEDLISEIRKLKNEMKALEEQLKFAETAIHDYSNSIIEYETQNYELRNSLAKKDDEIRQFQQMRENLEKAVKNEEDLGEICQELHTNDLINSTNLTLAELENILVTCKVEDHQDLSKKLKIESHPPVEYLNKLLCDLQEISHLSRESTFNCNQLKSDLEEVISEISSIKMKEEDFNGPKMSFDKDIQTEKFFKFDGFKKEESSLWEKESFGYAEAPMKFFQDKSTSVNIQEIPKETSNKAVETEAHEQESVECQTDDSISKSDFQSTNAVGAAWDTNFNSSVSEIHSLISQDDKKTRKIFQKQESLIDELNRELMVKDSELYEMQERLDEIEKINRHFKEEVSKMSEENQKQENLIEDLREKLRIESSKPKHESKAIDIQSLSFPRNLGQIAKIPEDLENLVSKSISESIKESLQHIEESYSIESSYKSPMNAMNAIDEETTKSLLEAIPEIPVKDHRNTPLVSRRSSMEIENIKRTSISLKGKNSKGVKSKSVQVISENTSQSNKKLVKTDISSKKEVKNKEEVQEISTGSDILAEGDSTPENVKSLNLEKIAWKIIKTGLESLSSDDLIFLHYQIVTAEMQIKSKTKTTTINFRTREISCTSISQSQVDSCRRIDDLLKRLRVCKLKSRNLQETLLYTTLEKILSRD